MKTTMLITVAFVVPALMALVDHFQDALMDSSCDSTSLNRVDLRIRDPFVLADGDRYYLYGVKRGLTGPVPGTERLSGG